MKKYLLPVACVAILGLGCSKTQMKSEGSVNQSGISNARLVNSLTLKIMSSNIQGIDFGGLEPGTSSLTKQLTGDIRSISCTFSTDGKAIQTAAFASISSEQGTNCNGPSTSCNHDPSPTSSQSASAYTYSQTVVYQIRLIESSPGKYGLAVVAN